MSNELERLQKWYVNQCNEEWEHTFGITISTLDNPGWLLEVDLTETELESRILNEVKIQRQDKDDWLGCVIHKKKFVGTCGPTNLIELIAIFLDWAG